METLNEYQHVLKTYKNYYQKNWKEIVNRYLNLISNYNQKEFQNVMLQHKHLILEIINQILMYYPEFSEIDSMILVTGSLARNTNLLFSDLDFSFFYDNHYKKRLYPKEEQIYYLLSAIFNFRGRDRIHGITFYLPHISHEVLDCMNTNNYCISFQDSPLYYKCRENAFETIYNTYNSTRSIKDLIHYINSHQSECMDWTNCFFSLKNNHCYENFYRTIHDFEKSHLKEINYISKLDKLYTDITNSIFLDPFSEKYIIKDLKKIYKNETLNYFYRLLAILHKTAIIHNINISTIDLASFSKLDLLSKLGIKSDLFEKGYYFLFQIFSLQYTLDVFGIDLSSHSNKNIYNKELNHVYKKIFLKENMINVLNNEKQSFLKEMQIVIIKMKEIFHD